MKKIFLLLSFALILAAPVIASACIPGVNADCPIVTCNKDCTIQDLFNMIDRIISFLLYAIAVPASVICLIIGGVMFTISGANPERANLGKKIVITTVIGMVLAFGGWLIVQFVLVDLLGVKNGYQLQSSQKSINLAAGEDRYSPIID